MKGADLRAKSEGPLPHARKINERKHNRKIPDFIGPACGVMKERGYIIYIERY